MDYSPPGSSINGIFQARILEWVAIAFSRHESSIEDVHFEALVEFWQVEIDRRSCNSGYCYCLPNSHSIAGDSSKPIFVFHVSKISLSHSQLQEKGNLVVGWDKANFVWDYFFLVKKKIIGKAGSCLSVSSELLKLFHYQSKVQASAMVCEWRGRRHWLTKSLLVFIRVYLIYNVVLISGI